jgi:lipopolysaccharide export system protein LptA
MPHAVAAILARAAAIAVIAVGSAMPQTAGASPAHSDGRTIQIDADALAVDAKASIATATGGVRISDGVRTATAARATIEQRRGRAVLVGDAKVTDPRGTIRGQEITLLFSSRAITRIVARHAAGAETSTTQVRADVITLLPQTESVTAEPNVTLLVKPDVVATGTRLNFARAGGPIVLEGPARVQTADGFIEGQRVEGDERLSRVMVTGEVHARYRGVDVRSRTAEIFSEEKRATFLGDVRVEQPGRTLRTDRVTVWYAIGRVLAEGPTHMRFESTP